VHQEDVAVSDAVADVETVAVAADVAVEVVAVVPTVTNGFQLPNLDG
jgi:hypothetical protein